MSAITAPRRPILLFALVATAIILGNFAISRVYQSQMALPVPEWVVGFDLLLLLPMLYLVLVRPSPAKALIAVLAIASLGILAGSYIIPQEDKQAWRVLEQVRWLYLGTLVLAQIALIASVVRDIRNHWSAPNLELAISAMIARRVPEDTIASLLQADARVWLYALVRDRSRFQPPEPAFYGWKHDSNASSQQAFLLLVAAEIPIAHVLVHLFDPGLALVVTSLSLYGLLFLYAEYRATLIRATSLDADALHIRHGVLGDLRIPYRDIRAVERVSLRPRRHARSLRYIGMGTANIRIVLVPETVLPTMLGRKVIESVYVGLDEPGVFQRELGRRVAAEGR